MNQIPNRLCPKPLPQPYSLTLHPRVQRPTSNPLHSRFCLLIPSLSCTALLYLSLVIDSVSDSTESVSGAPKTDPVALPSTSHNCFQAVRCLRPPPLPAYSHLPSCRPVNPSRPSSPDSIARSVPQPALRSLSPPSPALSPQSPAPQAPPPSPPPSSPPPQFYAPPHQSPPHTADTQKPGPRRHTLRS